MVSTAWSKTGWQSRGLQRRHTRALQRVQPPFRQYHKVPICGSIQLVHAASVPAPAPSAHSCLHRCCQSPSSAQPHHAAIPMQMPSPVRIIIASGLTSVQQLSLPAMSQLLADTFDTCAWQELPVAVACGAGWMTILRRSSCTRQLWWGACAVVGVHGAWGGGCLAPN